MKKKAHGKTVQTVRAKADATIKNNSGKRNLLPVLFVFVVTFIVFIPTLSAQFVVWDDPEFIYNNPLVTNISGDNFFQTIKEIFSTTILGAYSPLVILSFLIEKLVFGLEQPVFWHLDNLLLHLFCVYLVYRICNQLRFSSFVCFLVTLLFGIHPMRVESVAWLTERKDVLYGVFYLGALLMYLKYSLEGKQRKHLYWVYLFFIFSLFSKIQAVALPLSLLLIDYYTYGYLNKKMLLDKLPFFFLSVCVGMIGIYFLHQQSIIVNDVLSFPQRIVLASYTIIVYLIKSIVPYQLVTMYPYPTHISAEMYASFFILFLLLFIIYKAWKQKNKLVAFGLLFFVLNTVFVLQLLTAGQGYMADRYTYIPYLGIFILCSFLFEKMIRLFPTKKNLLQSICIAYFTILGYITFQQNKIWENTETLWGHVLKYYPEQTTPYINLAIYYHTTGADDKAIANYTEAINREPANAELYESRGKIYFEISGRDRGLIIKALEDCNKAISFNNKIAEYYTNRANIYGKLNILDSALADADKSILLDPAYPRAYYTRYFIYRMQNRIEDAIKDGEKYLSLVPGDNEIRNDLYLIKQNRK